MNNGKHGQETHCTKMGADIVRLKIPKMPQNLSAQFVYPSPKVVDFNEKMLHWASVVRDMESTYGILISKNVYYFAVVSKRKKKDQRPKC